MEALPQGGNAPWRRLCWKPGRVIHGHVVTGGHLLSHGHSATSRHAGEPGRATHEHQVTVARAVQNMLEACLTNSATYLNSLPDRLCHALERKCKHIQIF